MAAESASLPSSSRNSWKPQPATVLYMARRDRTAELCESLRALHENFLADYPYPVTVVEDAAEPLEAPAPRELQRLLSRLEVADRLAAGGHSLSLVELAQLVQLPIRSLEQRQGRWTWRDWQVCPAGEGRWRLERDAGGLEPRA